MMIKHFLIKIAPFIIDNKIDNFSFKYNDEYLTKDTLLETLLKGELINDEKQSYTYIDILYNDSRIFKVYSNELTEDLEYFLGFNESKSEMSVQLFFDTINRIGKINKFLNDDM